MKNVGYIIILLSIFSLSVSAQDREQLYQQLLTHAENGNYESCIELESKVTDLLLKQTDSLAFLGSGLLAEAYFFLGNTQKALDYYQLEFALREKLNALNSIEAVYCLQNIATIYFLEGKTKDALRYAAKQEQLAIVFKKSDPEFYYSTAFFQLDLQLKTNSITAAISQAETLLKSTSRQSQYFGLTQNKLGEALMLQGYFSKAEKNLEASVKNLQQLQVDSVVVAKAWANVALLYFYQGRFPEAEEIYSAILPVLQNSDDPEAYYAALNNQAIILSALSLNNEAIASYETILAFDEAEYGREHPYYSISLSNLAEVYTSQQSFNQSIPLLQQALRIDSIAYGANSYDYALTQNNLARNFRLSNQAQRSVPLLIRSAEIIKREAGAKSADYAAVLNNLAISYAITNPVLAKQPFEESLALRKKLLGTAHPKYGEATEWLARYSWMMNDLKSAKKHYLETFNNYYDQINLYFPILSENEKSAFYFGRLKPAFERFDNYVLQQHRADKSLTGIMYNNQLNTKALIMYATNKVRTSILNSGDSTLIRQFESYVALKEQLARLLSQSDPANTNKIDSTAKAANAIEKELTKKSSVFTRNFLRKQITWQEVRDKLNPGEAAVEIIRFREYKPDSAGRFTDDVRYVALIVKKDSKMPELLEIQDGSRLESRYINFYRNSIRYQTDDTVSYRIFWKPLQQKLSGVKRIYFSPDGVYNQLSLNSLKNAATGKFLLEEIEIDQVTNTRDLVEETQALRKGQAILYGFPTYNEGTQLTQATEKRALTRGTRGVNRGVRSGILRYMRGEEGIATLPGTKTEIETIHKILSTKDVQATVKLEQNADEYSVKEINSPYILHIATHGFFLEDAPQQENTHHGNPLLNSGLIMAGAGDFLLTGDLVKNTEQDGILTSFEAMNLKLDETELVVLSACETALGSVKNGEGVYGLQRALKIAGAKSIIMSLWSVDDDATQELMTTFYTEWLANGVSKKDAFRKAQQTIKTKFKHPFYWGAFILVGE